MKRYFDRQRYTKIFVIEPLPEQIYDSQTGLRPKYSDSLRIHHKIIDAYLNEGYALIDVPFNTPEERTKLILRNLI